MKRIEEHELLEEPELKERITEILCLVEEEGETIEITRDGVPIARLIPAHKLKQSGERDLTTFWKEMDRLAAEIGAHWSGDIDAIEAVRDVRRDL